MRNEISSNGVMIVRTATGIAVGTTDAPPMPPRVLAVEVEYQGKTLKVDFINSYTPWRDYYPNRDMLQCVVRVKDGTQTLAELGVPDAPLPFMVRQGEQSHITESYVAVPPALTITDERGDVWTMGFKTAQAADAPKGEFAFDVLRNGKDTGEIASRIERRGGKVRVLTKHGWKNWNGQFFF